MYEFIKIFTKNNEYYHHGKKIINLIQNSDDYCKKIKNDPHQLIFIDNTNKNYLELCKLAVQQRGYMIQSIPLENITEELCILAIIQEPNSIIVINDKILTEEMCKLAFELKHYSFRYIPDKYKSYEMCKLAVQKTGSLLHYIKEPFYNEELCKLAVQKCGYSIQYVKEPFYTKEMCELAVKRNGLSLQFIKKKFKNYELYKLAVENIGEALEYVPYKDRDENLCRIASKSERNITVGSLLEYIPQHLHTEEIYKNAVNRNVFELIYISPYNQQRYGLFSLAIKKDPYAICLIPHFYLTQKLCDLAYNKNKYMINYIPDEFKQNFENNSKL
jgi:hypothetical protein